MTMQPKIVSSSMMQKLGEVRTGVLLLGYKKVSTNHLDTRKVNTLSIEHLALR